MALLIDADIITYQACNAAEQEVEFETDVWQIYTDLNDAMRHFAVALGDLQERTKQSDYLLCFSDPAGQNFRKQLSPTYKANRGRKPVGYKALRDKIIASYPCRHYPRLEADDVLGILATSEPGHTIWSIDKDLRQIPGEHLGPDGEYQITQDEADNVFYTQVLTGDQVDNYKGCPGIGPVKAKKILSSPEGAWIAIVNAYECAGLTEADALIQARMARILRAGEYNSNTNKVTLWTPVPTTAA